MMGKPYIVLIHCADDVYIPYNVRAESKVEAMFKAIRHASKEQMVDTDDVTCYRLPHWFGVNEAITIE